MRVRVVDDAGVPKAVELLDSCLDSVREPGDWAWRSIGVGLPSLGFEAPEAYFRQLMTNAVLKAPGPTLLCG